MLSKLDGLIDELRGRFSIITKTTALTREEIMQLTTTQTLAEVNHDIQSLGVTVAFGEGGLDAFTTAVFALNVREPLGARRLPGFMFQIVTDEIMDVEGTELLITPELVDRAMQRVERANDTRVIGFK
jgi:ATP-dependent protease HslVU (ClpYQ) ATPase subunit